MAMARDISFWKTNGTGNDFIIVDNRTGVLAEEELIPFAIAKCPRRSAIGADGVMLIEPADKADFTMRLFNADGSEAEMCGNGIRCVALVALECGAADTAQRIDTLAGLIGATVTGNVVRVQMTPPGDVELIEGLSAAGQSFDVRFINTGVPHAVIYVDDTSAVPIVEWGRAVRTHERFASAGTNVNFVQLAADSLRIRTYERGVEDETLACGTGCVASAAVAVEEGRLESPVALEAEGGTLTVHIEVEAGVAAGAALEGPAEVVCRGVTAWGD